MFAIVHESIDVRKVLQNVKDDSSGATVLFLGTIRDHNDKGKVSRIHNEAYKEMAEEMLKKIEDEVIERWKVKSFIALQRVGELNIGDISLAVAVSSEHRKEAFEACKYTIDTIKNKVPIWKKEISPLGDSWVEGVSLG